MFSHKKGGVVEIGGDSKTVVVSLTNTTKLFLKLPFSVCGVCVCVLLIYIIFINILCVLKKGHNQQMDFYKANFCISKLFTH